MSLSLFLIIVACAIIVLFAEEFSGLGKKFFTIWGMKLVVPLFIVNMLVFDLQQFFLRDILYIARWFAWLLNDLAPRMPFEHYEKQVIGILLMLTFAIVPQFIIKAVRNYKKLPPFQYSKRLGFILWLLAAYFYTLSSLI